jgi:DNA-binding CsgD family transcriptional regulator
MISSNRIGNTVEDEMFGVPQALPVSVAIIDPAGKIVGVNDAWQDFGRRNGLRIANFGVGESYLHYCESDSHASLRLEEDLRDLLAGKLDLLTRIYPCHSPTEERWFFLIGLRLSSHGRSGAALLHVNLTPFLRCETPSKASHADIEPTKTLDLVARSIENSSLEALASQLTAMLAGGRQTPSGSSPQVDAERILAQAHLSKRQLQILGLLAEGKTNAEIARALLRSPNTIKIHVSKILRQLNVKSRTQAALFAAKLSNNDSRRDGA